MKKKILAVALAVTMLASMSISAAAGLESEGAGAIVFGILPDETPLPSFGGHNPTPPTTIPALGGTPITADGVDPASPPANNPIWPPFPPMDDTLPGATSGAVVRTAAAMQSSSLHFGTRDLPTLPAWLNEDIGWTSAPHQDWTAEQGLPATDFNSRPIPGALAIPAGHGTTTFASTTASGNSLLGLLWNQGGTGQVNMTANPPLPLGTLRSPANVTINARIGQFQIGTDATLDSFELLLRAHGNPGYLNVRAPRVTPNTDATPGRGTVGATIAGGTIRHLRPGLTVIDANALVQPTTPTVLNPHGPAVNLVSFQEGFLGIEWAGKLEGTWNGNNVTPGNAQTEILFTEAIVPIT
ncbi:MAG: hypothetical protein FWE19_08320 [Oscillospiraceae bacterium]|nr:hypothetical protein [Oscillospiraceae bacterium]